MKNGWKRTLSLLLCLVLLAGMFPTAMAQSPEQSSLTTQVVESTVQGSNSVGKLISNTLEGAEEESGDSPYSVTDITVEGTLATVEYMTDRDAELLVAIYEEESGRMLGSGHSAVAESSSKAEVRIEIESMPAYFVASAYLLDPEDHSPLCEAFVSRYYTREFQAFLATTVEDYDPDRVLNLDEDESTNFLVFGEDTILLEETAGVNELTDNGDGSYTIRHADARMKALQPGDSFAYTWQDGSVLVVLVQSASVDGDTVTVTENAEAELEDIFANVKIDGDSEDENAKVELDTSDMDEGLTYLGEDPNFSPRIYAMENGLLSQENEINGHTAVLREIDEENTYKENFSFKVEKEWKNGPFSGGITGAIKISFKATLKVYVSDDWRYIKNVDTYSIGPEFTLSGKVEAELLKFPLVKWNIAPGLTFESRLKITVSFELELNLSGSMKISSGFIYDSDQGTQKIDSSPQYEIEFKAEGTLKIGAALEVEVYLGLAFGRLEAKAFSIQASAGVDFTIKGTLKSNLIPDDDVEHDCSECVDGDVSVDLNADIKFKILNSTTTLPLFGRSYKLGDFYWSKDFGEFAFGTCPHIAYKVTATVLNEQEEPMQGVKILGTGLDEDPETDKDGVAVFFLHNGAYALRFVGQDLDLNKSITVHNGKKNLVINKGQSSSSSGQHCGSYLNWSLDEDGTLIISGTGPMDDYLNIPGYRYSPWYDKQESVKSIVIGRGVTHIGEHAFEGCSQAKSISISDTVESIGYNAFENIGCREIDIPASVVSIDGNPFWLAHRLEAFHVAEENPAYCDVDGILYTKDKTELCSFPYARGGDVIIPEGVTTIGEEAFLCNTDLSSVSLPDSLMEIKGEAFASCIAITSLEIPENVVSIGNAAFRGCDGLENITLREGLVSIGNNAFYNCERLQKITIPASVRDIGDMAFARCPMLAEIAVAPGSGSFCVVDGVLFSKDQSKLLCAPGCTAGAYTIPGSVTDIAAGAFHGCELLTSVSIPSGVTKIDPYVFSGCSSMTSIVIPKSVTSIDFSAFSECDSLTDVYYSGTEEEWKQININDVFSSNQAIHNATIHYNSSGPNAFEEPAGVIEPVPDTEQGGFLSEEEPAPGVIEPAEPDGGIELLAAVSGEDGDQNGMKLASFHHLIPGERYLFLATRNDKMEDLLQPENLLYVAEQIADENGNIFVLYLPRKTVIGASVTVYGPLSEYTVSFAVDGGETLEPITAECFSTVTLPAAERSGYLFRGWATEQGGAAVYQAGDKLELREDLTLYAVWQEILETNLRATPEGTNSNYARITVPLNEAALLKVNAHVDAGGLRYRWTCSSADASFLPEGEETSSVTIPRVDHSYSVTCTVLDDNDNSVKVYFGVYVDTGLQAFVQGTTQTEQYFFETESNVKLAVDASVKLGGLGYSWSYASEENINSYRGVSGAASSELTVDGSVLCNYMCRVYDDYGDSKYVYFRFRPGLATALSINQETAVSSYTPSGELYVSFSPERTGTYTLKTADGDPEAYCKLLGEQENEYYYSFPYVAELEAGKTYYYLIEAWPENDFTLHLTMKAEGFATWEELQEQLNNSAWGDSFSYIGDEDPVILSSDLVIPSGVTVKFPAREFVVAEGARVIIEEQGALQCRYLTAEGAVQNSGEILCRTVTGREKVAHLSEDATTTQQSSPETEAEMESFLQRAAAEEDPHYKYQMIIEQDLTVTGTLSTSPNMTVHLAEGTLTIASGASLEILGVRKDWGYVTEGYLLIYGEGKLVVLGTLINNGDIDLYKEDGLILEGDGVFAGDGELWFDSEMGAPEEIFPWLSLPEYAAYTVREENGWYCVVRADGFIKGDLNRDREVNGQDLICMRRLLAGIDITSVYANADTNGDGTVDILDLVRLAKYLAGENVSLG